VGNARAVTVSGCAAAVNSVQQVSIEQVEASVAAAGELRFGIAECGIVQAHKCGKIQDDMHGSVHSM
jgi:hypothetical protein